MAPVKPTKPPARKPAPRRPRPLRKRPEASPCPGKTRACAHRDGVCRSRTPTTPLPRRDDDRPRTRTTCRHDAEPKRRWAEAVGTRAGDLRADHRPRLRQRVVNVFLGYTDSLLLGDLTPRPGGPKLPTQNPGQADATERLPAPDLAVLAGLEAARQQHFQAAQEQEGRVAGRVAQNSARARAAYAGWRGRLAQPRQPRMAARYFPGWQVAGAWAKQCRVRLGAARRKVRWKLDTESLEQLIFSPDERTFIAGRCQKSIIVWDVTDGTKKKTIRSANATSRVRCSRRTARHWPAWDPAQSRS